MSAPRSGIPWATAVSPFPSFAGPAVYVTTAFDDMEDIPVISSLFAIYLFFFLTYLPRWGSSPSGFLFVIKLYIWNICA